MDRLDDFEYAAFKEAYEHGLVLWYDMDEDGIIAGLDANELFASAFSDEGVDRVIYRIPPRYIRYCFKGDKLADEAKKRNIVKSVNHSSEYVLKKERLDVPDGKYTIRGLIEDDIDDVLDLVENMPVDYVMQQVEEGLLFGLFEKGRKLMSVAGEHYERTITLFGSSKDSFKKGYDKALLSYVANKVLSEGRRAVIFVFDDDGELKSLVEDLGFSKTHMDSYWG